MSIELSNKLHQMGLTPKLVKFWCPGCNCAHAVTIRDGAVDHPSWEWNGDAERPTFRPSILVQSGHYAPGQRDGECWCTFNAKHPDSPSEFKCGVCHSFVTDGRIQFLGDCTHALAGQTVDLPDIPACE